MLGHSDARQAQLGLNEARLTINKSSLGGEPQVDLYYQLRECFACPMQRLKSLESDLERLTLSSRFEYELELRKANESQLLCRAPDVRLNNQAHYMLELVKDDQNCQLKTLSRGECSLCPVAYLAALALVLFLAEQAYYHWVSSRFCSSGAVGDPSQADENSAATDHQHRLAADEHRWRAPKASASERLTSLDVFRGLTMSGMIVVNYGGAGLEQLEHALWDGITVADFVFPFFVFAMGASVAISAANRSSKRHNTSLSSQLLDSVRRSAILFFIGLCLNSRRLAALVSLEHLRVTGVMQQIAVSYLATSTVYKLEIWLNKRCQMHTQQQLNESRFARLIQVLCELLLAINMIAIYLYVNFFLDYSHLCPPGYLGPGGLTEQARYFNCTGGAASWLDRLLIGEQHLYDDQQLKEVFKTETLHDPEGILGYTMSTLLSVLGLQAGKIIFARPVRHKAVLVRLGNGAGLLYLCTLVCAHWIPINKHLWSLSFVTVTGATGFLVLALVYLATDVYKWHSRSLLFRLLRAAGKNSIFLYAGHSLVEGMLPWSFYVDRTSRAQLLFLLSWSTLVWLLAAGYMESKRIFVRV